MKHSAIKPLNQLFDLLQSIDKVNYTASWQKHSTIGSHARHIIEYIDNFLIGLKKKNIDYDNRPRNPLYAESPAIAAEKLSQQLQLLNNTIRDATPITVYEAVDDNRQKIQSTIEREFVFIISHATHHLGIISLLATIHNLQTAPNMGKAVATLQHEQQCVR